jgi:hypothetical protein
MPVPAWFSEVYRDLLRLSEINSVGGRRILGDSWRYLEGCGVISETHRESGGQYMVVYGGLLLALTADRPKAV